MMRVVSLFNGMNCIGLAMDKANFKYDELYIAEIDSHANKISNKNYPDAIQIGDVTKIDTSNLPKIDLLVGGSPCTNLSFAGKRSGMTTTEDVEIITLEQYLDLKEKGFKFKGQSYLFWEYVRILTELRKVNPDIKFMLENTQMPKKWKDIFDGIIGVTPVKINSTLVSAQNRVRWYWANFKITQPEDRKIFLNDILQNEEEIDEKYYLTDEQISKIDLVNINKHIEKDIKLLGHRKGYNKNLQVFDVVGKSGCLDTCTGGGRHPHVLIKINKKGGIKENQSKASCFTAGGNSGGNHSDMDLLVREATKKGYARISPGDCVDLTQINSKTRRGRAMKEKSNCLTTSVSGYCRYTEDYRIRRLTPIECERLQTVPDSYTEGVSDSQRYKMLGNGWTVDVITHILDCLQKEVSVPIEECVEVSDKFVPFSSAYLREILEEYVALTPNNTFKNNIARNLALNIPALENTEQFDIRLEA